MRTFWRWIWLVLPTALSCGSEVPAGPSGGGQMAPASSSQVVDSVDSQAAATPTSGAGGGPMASGTASSADTQTSAAANGGAGSAATSTRSAGAPAAGSPALVTTAPGTAGAAGSDMSTSAAGSSGSAGQAAPSGPATGRFPAITDPWMAGPFAVATMGGAGPSRNATVLYPRELGKDGVKHPIVVWDNGAGQTGLSIYGALLNHMASHGFAVYAAFSATDEGKELLDGLDWMIAQAADSSSPFFEKLDTTKTASAGHSQGSIATFAIAADPRLTTTMHLSGGTNPDIAQGHATLPNLHNPAAFLCGEPGGDGLVAGDAASEWCAWDFEHTDVPVFLTQVQGASHITAPGMMLGACAAWLRWHLAEDSTMRMQFAGDDCVLCKRRNWKTMSKGL